MGFFSALQNRVQALDSFLCVGLDPHPDDLAQPSAAEAVKFCLKLIEATADLAAAYKPNAAFFEAFGPDGMIALRDVIAAVPQSIPVILDAKRGDIASTAEAYARAAFQTLGATALTVNPYLGQDSIEPFIADPAHGVFLLCKTSNPGSTDLQDLPVYHGPLYEHVARLAQSWNQRDNLGLVVGATHPDALARIRASAPDLWFLAPGVGAQGGDLTAALHAGLRSDGLGMLIPVSRAVSRAADPRRAAHALVEDMRRAVSVCVQKPATPLDLHQARLADALLGAGCIKFGQFTLKSGLISPIYLDLRQLVAFPRLLDDVAAAYVKILRRLSFDRLAALPYAALPIGTAVSLQGNWPMIYPRKEAKTYGTKADIEGIFQPGETVAVVDDLATTGGSKFEAIEKLTAAGLKVRDVIVLIDRQSGASESLAQAGYRLHAVLAFTQLLDSWEQNGKVPSEKIAEARAFLKGA